MGNDFHERSRGSGSHIGSNALSELVSCPGCNTRRKFSKVSTRVYVLCKATRGLTFENSFLGVTSGAIRGCGNQHIGFVVNLLAYYVIAIPIGILLAFHFQLGLAGLWYGLAIGSSTQAICLCVYVCRVDYDLLALAAAQRCDTLAGEEGAGVAAEGAGGGTEGAQQMKTLLGVPSESTRTCTKDSDREPGHPGGENAGGRGWAMEGAFRERERDREREREHRSHTSGFCGGF
jgi:hypothetical protein